MANDTATTRLLYAILSQKCLKDIDWNKVAHDPILSQEITNGHAARMRYSRFKKQMDGTAGVRRPRNTGPASPHKKKVEKNSKSPRKVKERNPSDAGERIKPEAGESGYSTAEGTPEGSGSTPGAVVKSEHASGSEESLYSTSTPVHSDSPTPSPGFPGPAEIDEIMTSFSMPGAEHLGHEQLGHEHMYPGVLEDPNHAYGMGIQMPMGLVDPFENLWHQQQSQDEGSVLVKTEPRWEDTYRHG